ncbi:MAG: hypothetical protein LBE75_01890 [Burkholderiales bacterium]|jgi:hypothetical protein|nr:hypothetical protein [Burkholderiales bacterium]
MALFLNQAYLKKAMKSKRFLSEGDGIRACEPLMFGACGFFATDTDQPASLAPG